MLQGKRWFDLFLNRHSFEFVENKYNKVDAITVIKKSVQKLMVGMNLKTVNMLWFIVHQIQNR
jgi:hypothetical protein